MSQRIVYAGHGTERAMGYKYRARVEKTHNDKWTYVIEEHFISWGDMRQKQLSFNTKEEAEDAANKSLDYLAAKPSDDKKFSHYVTVDSVAKPETTVRIFNEFILIIGVVILLILIFSF